MSGKIFGIGLPKTATTSLAVAMKKLGFSTNHLPFSLNEISKVDFCNDITVVARLEILEKIYPNSLYIYTVRDKQKWIDSTIRWYKRPGRSEWLVNLKREKGVEAYNFLDQSFVKVYGVRAKEASKMDGKYLSNCYDNYHQKIKSQFIKNEAKKSKVMILDVTSKTAFSELVSFLEKKGVITFPKANENPNK